MLWCSDHTFSDMEVSGAIGDDGIVKTFTCKDDTCYVMVEYYIPIQADKEESQ